MTQRMGWIAAGLLLVLGAWLLGGMVSGTAPGATDRAIEGALALRRGEAPDALIAIWQAISWIGGGGQRYIVVILCAILLARWSGWQSGAAMILAAFLSNMASNAMKAHFARPRPDMVPHLDHVNSFSYTSGHATSAALVYLLFVVLVPTAHRGRWLAAGFIAAFLTGWSRIALGVHWPSDVLGGWMLGGAFVLFAMALMPRAQQG